MTAIRVYVPARDAPGYVVGSVRDALGRRFATVRLEARPGVKPELLTIPEDEVTEAPLPQADVVARTRTGAPLRLILGGAHARS